MAQHNGYSEVPHGSYDEFKNATINEGWNVDYYGTIPYGGYGNQCWDLVALLYWQYGLTLYTGNPGYAYTCWTQRRTQNSAPPFYSVEDVRNIKRGDIIVWNRSSSSATGHIAFADEDYNGTNRINSFGQVPSLHGINGTAQVDNVSLNNFLGIFRNANWQSTPPTPPAPSKKQESKFPWIIAWRHWPGFRIDKGDII